jgi:hypothetical protein
MQTIRTIVGYSLFFLCFLQIPVTTFSQSAGSSGAGGGGGGGGQNVYGFKYFLAPKGNGFAYSILGITGEDWLLKDSSYTVTDSSYYLRDSSYLKDSSGHYHLLNDSVFKLQTHTRVVKQYCKHKILFYNFKAGSSVAILGRNQDTCMLEFWPPVRRTQRDSAFNNGRDIIEGIPNYKLYNHDTINADTFYLVAGWQNSTTLSRHRSFNLPFHTLYFVPATIPIEYVVKTKQFQTNLLSAGMAFGLAVGRTKFFKDNIMPPRNAYYGAGIVGGVTAVTVSAQGVSNQTIKTEIGTGSYTYPAFYVGEHAGYSFNSVQLFVALGWEWATGHYARYWNNQGRAFIGFGIGLSLFNLAVPSISSTASAH